jgi:hypothetical protein
VVRDIPENGVALAEEMKRRNLDFTNLAAVEQMVVDSISVGKLYLNPAAISAEFEQRYGDERYGAYRCPASVPPISPCSPAASFRRNRTRVSSARTNIGTRILSFRNVTVRTAQPRMPSPSAGLRPK